MRVTYSGTLLGHSPNPHLESLLNANRHIDKTAECLLTVSIITKGQHKFMSDLNANSLTVIIDIEYVYLSILRSLEATLRRSLRESITR